MSDKQDEAEESRQSEHLDHMVGFVDCPNHQLLPSCLTILSEPSDASIEAQISNLVQLR